MPEFSCTTNNNWLFRSFDYFNQAPALVLAQWTGLRDTDKVAYLGVIVFVMCHELFGHFHRLPVQRVTEATLHLYTDGLCHLVADDDPNPRFS